jgi:DNA polymerase-3 subunit delta'
MGYNPAMNGSVLGHAWAVELLQRHVRAGSVRHAYLFTGPDQVGKRTLALAFAVALNCLEPPRAGEACGRCRLCAGLKHEQHADLSVVRIGADESEIKIDAMRELQRHLALTPHEATWRMALLVDFDLASVQAQNALLKTLEEPPQAVVLLLTARSTANLLPTIVSRCEVLNLRPVHPQLIEQALRSEGLAPERARLLAAISGGRPGLARTLAADEELLTRRAAALDELMLVLAGGRGERFAVAERLARKLTNSEELESVRRRAEEGLLTWLTLGRDALLLSHGADALLANPDRRADLDRLATSLPPEALATTVRALQTTLDRLDRNANIQLALENLMLDLPRLPGH